MKVRATTDNGKVILWDEESGVGLQFTEGETLQLYTATIVLADPAKMETEVGVKEVSRISQLLTDEAAALYPKEFAPMQDPKQ